MEALTAASVAALTIYDMCKAIDRAMVVTDLRLLRKSGGKSGDYEAPSLEADPKSNVIPPSPGRPRANRIVFRMHYDPFHASGGRIPIPS